MNHNKNKVSYNDIMIPQPLCQLDALKFHFVITTWHWIRYFITGQHQNQRCLFYRCPLQWLQYISKANICLTPSLFYNTHCFSASVAVVIVKHFSNSSVENSNNLCFAAFNVGFVFVVVINATAALTDCCLPLN